MHVLNVEKYQLVVKNVSEISENTSHFVHYLDDIVPLTNYSKFPKLVKHFSKRSASHYNFMITFYVNTDLRINNIFHLLLGLRNTCIAKRKLSLQLRREWQR
jgi:hypothetical protein